MRKAPSRAGVKPPVRIIALGANLASALGGPGDALCAALDRLAATPGIKLAAVSRFVVSAAHPPGSGPDYVNAAANLATDAPPEALLARLHAIEAELGRVREGTGRWSARVIDLDLIAWDEAVRPDAASQGHWRTLAPAAQRTAAPDRLILPHPRMQDRRFVLGPMAEVTPPGWRHPLTGQTVAQMLAILPPDGA